MYPIEADEDIPPEKIDMGILVVLSIIPIALIAILILIFIVGNNR